MHDEFARIELCMQILPFPIALIRGIEQLRRCSPCALAVRSLRRRRSNGKAQPARVGAFAGFGICTFGGHCVGFRVAPLPEHTCQARKADNNYGRDQTRGERVSLRPPLQPAAKTHRGPSP